MQALILNKSSALHKTMLIGDARSARFMGGHNLGITTLKPVIWVPNIFLKSPENQITANFIYLIYLTFSDNILHKLLRPSQFLEKLWKFLNGELCANTSGPSTLLNVAVYCKSSNAISCAKRLPQILANNSDNEGKDVGLRIYMRYCLQK